MTKNIQLSFYLFRPNVMSFEQALDCPNAGMKPDGYEVVQLADGVPFDASAYIQTAKASAPGWMQFIEPYCVTPKIAEIKNRSNSFILLIRLHGGKAIKWNGGPLDNVRIFAVSAGHGHNALNSKNIEREFGLRCTLNCIDPDKIRSVDVRNIDPLTRQKRTFINQDSPLYEFRLDLDEEMIKLVTGQPSEAALGTRMQGSDSLALASDVSFHELGSKCELLLQSFEKTLSPRFKFVEDVRAEHDPNTIEALDDRICLTLVGETTATLAIAFPGADERYTTRYRIYKGHQSLDLPELCVDQVCEFVKDKTGSLEDLARIHVRAYDADDHYKQYQLRDFLVLEMDHGNKTYVLSDGQWYNIAPDFLNDVNTFVGALDTREELTLPPMRLESVNTVTGPVNKYRVEDEGRYNERVVQGRTDLICLDRKLIRTKSYGRGSVEACDILSKSGEFICVKKGTNSASLSHLFAQGSVSAQLLCDDKDYYAAVMERCPSNWNLPFQSDVAQRDGITIVFGIATKSMSDWTKTLPIFSKINLRAHTRIIQRRGFHVALLRIGIEDATEEAVVLDDYDGFADEEI